MIGLLSRHADVEGHFDGTATPTADRKMFAHLPSCERCREQYRTLAMLEALEAGGGDRARERLARGVFAPAGAGKPTRAMFGTGLVLAFGCVALVVSFGRGAPSFRARGGVGAEQAQGTEPSLAIYRVPRDRENPERLAVGETRRAGSVMHAGESLAFSYTSPAALGVGYLMVFARDAGGRVYWFWPAWSDEAADPTSLSIAATAEPIELTEAVRHPLPAGPLTIVGLFTPRPLHVREVEAALAKGPTGLQAFEGHIWTDTLEVSP
jgi:hypothetical protein